MKALTTGVNQLVQGEVYALPAFPCQILSTGYLITSQNPAGPFNYFNTDITEPGVFVNGGFIKSAGTGDTAIIKKHTIGKSNAATNYTAAVMMDNPSYYWRLNELSAAVPIVDRIQGLNGTASGGITIQQPGALVDGDKCMVFDGVSGQIVTENGTFKTPFTIEMWIRRNSNVADQVLFCNTWGASDNIVIKLAVGGINAYTGTSGPSVAFPYDTQWHHVLLVCAGAGGIFYIDGIGISSDPTPIMFTTGTLRPLEIGNDPNWIHFNGSLDEVAIYPYALSQGQITQHYMARSSPFIVGSYASKVIASGPSNYWRLGETYGTTAVDVIGGANGTISGGVTLGGESGMTFDGTSGTKIDVPVITFPTVALTVEFWGKLNTFAGGLQFLIASTLMGANFIGVERSVQAWYSRLSTGGVFRIITLPGADLELHHFALTYNGSLLILYLDGINRVSSPGSGSIDIGGSFVIGNFSDGTYGWKGTLDEVAIYPRALSATEILAHYQAR